MKQQTGSRRKKAAIKRILRYLTESPVLTDTVIISRIKTHHHGRLPVDVRTLLQQLAQENVLEVVDKGFVCSYYRLNPLYALASL